MKKRYRCKACHEFYDGPRASGRCVACGMKRMKRNVRQQREKRGKFYDAWRESMKKVAERLG